MLIPALHPEEAKRLKVLHGLNLLETPIEERFERITRTARPMLGVPIAAISLVGEARQWFKSAQGLDISELGRDESFCGHALLAPGPFVVPDARRDERFADNPLVTGEPGIRFYAAWPVLAGGVPVGTLCVADYRPRGLGPRQSALLRSLAQVVEVELAAPVPSRVQRALIAELDAPRRRCAVDTVTRLWNRPAILDILGRELAHARHRRSGIGTVFVGMDGDRAGGAADATLRSAARRLVGTLRPQDSVGRFGARQFLGIVPHADRFGLLELAGQVRERVIRTPARAAPAEVTFSVGATWAPGANLPDSGALLDAATAALCAAHHRGGNRVEFHAP